LLSFYPVNPLFRGEYDKLFSIPEYSGENKDE
jgi:hypothetical protein